jgi:hypothetical protein
MGPRQQCQHDRDRGDGHVDPEDRPPGPRQEEAARDRADRREPARDAEEDCERLPRSRGAKELTTIARAAGKRSAPDAPCSTRKPTSHASAPPPVGVSPQRADVAANPTVPTRTMRRWPTTSLSLPPSANRCRQREQVAVDHPLRADERQPDAPLDVRHRDRDDRLIHEHHRDGEDHRRQHEVPAVAAHRS